MTGEQSNSGPDSGPVQDSRSVIESQVQILRRLNDELLRTVRIHAVLGGGLVTLISLFRSEIGWAPPTEATTAIILISLIMYAVSLIALVFVGPAWVGHLLSARLSYTDLYLGVKPGIDEPASSESKENVGTIENLKSVLFSPVHPLDYEEQYTPEEVMKRMLAPDNTTAVRNNSMILKSREDYVNRVQFSLNTSFLLLVGSTAGLIVL